MECLRVEKLSKSFGALMAINNVSLSLQEGERRAIIGPNGAGKTTLLNLITGQLLRDTGNIYFYGQKITTMPVHQRVHLKLARTFQLNNIFLNLTVLHNILLAIQAQRSCRFGIFRPLSKYKSLFDEAEELLNHWNMWEKRDTLVDQLSYGEQRYIELILCLSSNPKLVLLDEPTAGLSPMEADTFITKLQNLGRKITVLMIEHNMDAVFKLADYTVAEGDKEKIRVDPKVVSIYLGR
jgi:branched-chain amino acid transport system ATP-binding protein